MHAHACASVHVEAVEGEDEVQGSRTESVAAGSTQRGISPCTTSRLLRPDHNLPQTEKPDILLDEYVRGESCRECMH